MSAPGKSKETGGHAGVVSARTAACLLFVFFAAGFLAPSLVYAAPQSFADLVRLIIGIINPLVGFLITCALLFFFFNIIRYISSANTESKGKYKENIVWGIIALFVLVSFFGLASILRNTLLGVSTAPIP